MWFLKRMLRVSSQNRITNDEVLQPVDEGRQLLTEMKKRQMKFIDHLIMKD